MALTVTIYNITGASYVFTKILSFQLKKEVYTPYTAFSAQLDTEGLTQFGTVCRIVVQYGSRVLHEGSLEEMTVRTHTSATWMTILSYGFTKLLLHNELEPGLYPNLSVDALLTGYYTFPDAITWEANADTSNYVYFKEHIPVWDGVVTLCYKLLGRYPYIRGSNQVCLHLPSDAKTMRIQTAQTLAYGTKRRYRSMISHFHMQDVDGTYNQFSLVNPQATAVYQLRHKQISFDRSYAYNPQKALEFRSNVAQNGWFQQFVTLSGMVLYDLNDCLTIVDGMENGRISAITWKGTQTGISTTFSVYFDAFQNA
jgi:hypothetical protein